MNITTERIDDFPLLLEVMQRLGMVVERDGDDGLTLATVNPRPYDAYNVQNNEKEMQIIYEGYPLQRELDYVHARLGSPDLNYRTCACYLDEVGNAPKPGTYVAWAESSAVNYGNSVLGIRTNRNGAGMDLIQAMLGKAPKFGLMTDEGRMAKWLVEVKTTKEPDWGTVGTAIGRKVVEDVPLVAGIDKYFESGEVTEDNLHLLKAMGSASAASGSVGLYHVEGLTPEGKTKGRKLLVKDYQTYVYDDAEEQNSGAVNHASSDLELVLEKEIQTVGLRFNGVNIPQGSIVSKAYIQFQADEADAEVTALTIEGEAIDHAETFVAVNSDVSLRPRTSASVAWAPAPWNVGEAGPAQQTSDIAAIIEEIVGQTKWVSGNSLAIIISGSGKRSTQPGLPTK